MARKQSIYGYSPVGLENFLKISTNSTTQMNSVRKLFENGLAFGSFPFHNYATFESNIPLVLRFMIDLNITGMNWIRLPAGKYKVRPDYQASSLCQLEVDIQ